MVSSDASIYYKWSKAFLEAGKNGLTKDTLRNAASEEIKRLKAENQQLKESLADSILETQRYKKSLGL
jgi:transposase